LKDFFPRFIPFPRWSQMAKLHGAPHHQLVLFARSTSDERIPVEISLSSLLTILLLLLESEDPCCMNSVSKIETTK
jgi:hypothetical protein